LQISKKRQAIDESLDMAETFSMGFHPIGLIREKYFLERRACRLHLVKPSVAM